jgi:hypothetical protein
MGVLKRRGLPRLAGFALAVAGFALAVLLAVLLARGGDETASAHFPPTPGTPHPGLDFSIGVNTDANTGTGDARGDDCVSYSVQASATTTPPPAIQKCNIPPSAAFTVHVYLNSLGGISNYGDFDIRLDYTGVTAGSFDAGAPPTVGGNWPDCSAEASLIAPTPGRVLGGCSMAVGATPSMYTGRIATVDFACAASGNWTITMWHGAPVDGNGGTDLDEVLNATPPNDGHSEISGSSEQISINCDAPTLTPTSTPTATKTNTPIVTNTPTVTNTPLFSPTPTGSFTPTLTLSLTPTNTPYPELSILAQGTRVSCDAPTPPSTKSRRCQAPVEATPKNGEFQIVVDANHIPGSYGGFNSEVLFGGLDLNSRSCLEEVVWPGAFLCSQIVAAPSKQHKARTAIFPPFPLSTYIGALVRINTHCPREGQFKVVLPAFIPAITPVRPQAAAFYNADDTPVPVATVGVEPLDLTGDGVPDTTPSYPLAGALIINCLVISTPTITLTPTVTPTATATPCDGPCPTAAPTNTPTATNTATPANTVPPTNTPTRTNTPAPTNTATPTVTLTPAPVCREMAGPTDLTAPGKVTTDTAGDGATSHDLVETSVTTTGAGQVSICGRLPVLPNPTGFRLFGQQVDITAPAATATRPLNIIFWLDVSIIPPGTTPDDVQLFKGGVLVPNCSGTPSTASPDPCVTTRSLLIGTQAGDVKITVLSSTASSWTFATSTGALGDVNCDGYVNPIDAALILQYAAGIISSLPCPANADVNGDGRTDPRDALLILQFDAGLISILPAGEPGRLAVWSGFAGLAAWARRR